MQWTVCICADFFLQKLNRPSWRAMEYSTQILNHKGQSLSNQAKTVEMAEIENEIFSTNTPMKEKAISSERRAVDFVPAFQSKHDIRQVVEKFREKVFAHNLDQNTTEQGKPSESEVVDKPSEKQVHEESSTAGEQSRKVTEKFHEKVFQSAHNLNQNTTEQGEPSESEVVDKNIAGLAEKRGGARGDSNEDEVFNETDFESSHHNDQNLGKLFWKIFGKRDCRQIY